MTTTAELIDATERHVMSGFREPRNKLNAAYTAAGTSLSFEFPLQGIKDQSYIEIDTEVFYVWSIDEGAQTAVVSGAQQGSTAANHASGATVRVNPRFGRFPILKALQDEMLSLSAPGNLFRVSTVDLTYSAGQEGYDLTSVGTIQEILEVRAKAPGPEKSWPIIRGWQLARDMATSEFASGEALILGEGGYPGLTVRVRYKAPFAALPAASTDITTDTGLHAEAHDIPPLGAAMRLLSFREAKRNFPDAQGEPRRAEEVGPGAVLASARGFAALKMQRVSEEKDRLHRYYPTQRAF